METPRRLIRQTHLQNVQKISTPLRLPPSPLMKNLGYGTGVNVYRLDRSPKFGEVRSPWAVKRVPQRFRTHEHADLYNSRIHKEAEFLRKLSHPNIVGFRGIIKSEDGVETLVLECCKTSLGDLLEERFGNNAGPLPANKTINMIIDVARGLDYLHTEAKVLHGDLKSFNVLVKGDFEICKLCDFGVSLPLDEKGEVDFTKNPNLNYVGTGCWCAPEVIDEAKIIDSTADIFSFGLVIYETIALVPPHTLNYCENEETTEESDITFDSEDENSDRAYGTRPPLPQAFDLIDDYNCILEIFYCCTNERSEDRPQAKTIWKSFLDQKGQANKKNDSGNA